MTHTPATPDPARQRRARVDDGLTLIGLVGRAGSGKTTVASVLRARGARVLDADKIGHEMTDTDPAVREAMLREYGPAVYLDDGRLNRRLVATKVFADPGALERLNSLVHPRILRRLREQIAALPGEGYGGAVLIDAALMLDWAFERDCDAVLAVIAPEEAQVARLVRARGWTETEALRRLAAQRTNEAFAAAADEVIDNRGSEADLSAAAASALERLVTERSARGI
jgi:dephospho-CoA kinase